MFFVGILVGVVGALLSVKLRRDGLPEQVEDLAERIQSNLSELESRVKSAVAAEH